MVTYKFFYIDNIYTKFFLILHMYNEARYKMDQCKIGHFNFLFKDISLENQAIKNNFQHDTNPANGLVKRVIVPKYQSTIEVRIIKRS